MMLLETAVSSHFLIFLSHSNDYLPGYVIYIMAEQYQTSIFGQNLDLAYVKGFENGKKEQLQRDVVMIRNVAFRSRTFEEFKEKLREEIGKMDNKTWF